MKTTSTIFLALSVLLLAACTGGGFKKTKSGLLYKVISDKKNPIVKTGEFLKVHYTQKVRDSVLSSSFSGLPTYARVDSVGEVYNPLEVFGKLRKGDSAVVVMVADSLQKKQGQLPPYIRKGDKLTLTLKVVDVLKTEEDVRNDQIAQMEQKKQSEVIEIEKYLAEKNIKAQKTDKGVFVVVDEKGQAPYADSGKQVKVMYRGTTFQGVVFDTNRDTSFGHPQPYSFVVGERGAIDGWDDGIRLFGKGGKGTLYVPSMLAYGPNVPPNAPFKAFENLIFEVEIVDITTPEKRPAQMPGITDPRMRPRQRATTPSSQQQPAR